MSKVSILINSTIHKFKEVAPNETFSSKNWNSKVSQFGIQETRNLLNLAKMWDYVWCLNDNNEMNWLLDSIA